MTHLVHFDTLPSKVCTGDRHKVTSIIIHHSSFIIIHHFIMDFRVFLVFCTILMHLGRMSQGHKGIF